MLFQTGQNFSGTDTEKVTKSVQHLNRGVEASIGAIGGSGMGAKCAMGRSDIGVKMLIG